MKQRLPELALSVSCCGAAPCPQLGANRKRRALGQSVEIDPQRSLVSKPAA